MKRVNDVIDLPVSADDKGVNDSNGIRFLGDFYCSKEKIEATVRSINNADALVDALEFMIANNWSHSFNRREAETKAKAVLATYRGDK